jgi:cholesterol oxidase
VQPTFDPANKESRMTETDPDSAATAADAVVIGSGFGGSVAAARLTQAGLKVVVLERGRRWGRGEFPRNTSDLDDRWLWDKNRGLYDIRWLDSMISVQAAGWGGGSLIYANVFSRPSPHTFTTGWPEGYCRTALDPYYDLVAHMLEVRPIAENAATGRYPARTVAMERMAERAGRPAGTVRPLLAVNFGDPGAPNSNRHGVTQTGCTFVGECVLGCNAGAKNSLDYNYLAVAERDGARVVTGSEVTAIRAVEAGYQVTAVGDDSVSRQYDARMVFVAAGAVATTELLLRSRDVSGGLPHLSPSLGERFSGNGDYLAFIRGKDVPADTDDGPTITTTTVVDFAHDGRRTWFQAQDGGYPRLIAELIANSDPTRAPRQRLSATVAKGIAAIGIRVPPRPRKRSNRMTMLLMGRDTATGRLTLDHNSEARLAWPYRDNRRLYTAEGQVARWIARSLGGRMTPSPAWRFLRQAVTVHNLGGVPMGDSAADSVVDTHGEAHGHPGLYVIDGAVLPSATGVNPSATIAAVAERNIEAAIRAYTGDPTWHAPEWGDVTPAPIPEDDAFTSVADAADRTSGGGIVFHERLRGVVVLAGGRRELTLNLRCAITGWNAFAADPRHTLDVTGTAAIDGIPGPLPVDGTLALFADDSAEAMRYSLQLRNGPGSAPMRIEGRKLQAKGNPIALWPDLTRMQLWVHQAEAGWTKGYARIHPADVLRLAASVRGTAFTRRRRITVYAKFVTHFAQGALHGLTGHRGGSEHDRFPGS